MLDISLRMFPEQEGMCKICGIPTILHARSGTDRKHCSSQAAYRVGLPHLP